MGPLDAAQTVLNGPGLAQSGARLSVPTAGSAAIRSALGRAASGQGGKPYCVRQVFGDGAVLFDSVNTGLHHWFERRPRGWKKASQQRDRQARDKL